MEDPHFQSFHVSQFLLNRSRSVNLKQPNPPTLASTTTGPETSPAPI